MACRTVVVIVVINIVDLCYSKMLLHSGMPAWRDVIIMCYMYRRCDLLLLLLLCRHFFLFSFDYQNTIIIYDDFQFVYKHTKMSIFFCLPGVIPAVYITMKVRCTLPHKTDAFFQLSCFVASFVSIGFGFAHSTQPVGLTQCTMLCYNHNTAL